MGMEEKEKDKGKITIHVQMPIFLHEALAAYAEDRMITMSAAIRLLLAEHLKGK